MKMMENIEKEETNLAVEKELECLNVTSEKINLLENELSNKRKLYKCTLSDSTQNLKFFSKKYGESINKARPYYDAVAKAKIAHNEIQIATLEFERAVSMHDAAKEMVLVAEQGMLKDASNRMDTAWPEMLNHATIRVNDAEACRHKSEIEHERCADLFKTAEREVSRLEKKLKSAVSKSRPYFEANKKIQERLEELRSEVYQLESDLKKMKFDYTDALRRLEEISESIHKQRGTYASAVKELGVREDGVGAESSPQLSSPNTNRKKTSPVDLLKSSYNDKKALVLTGGIFTGSVETLSSVRSNGSGSSEVSISELSQHFEHSNIKSSEGMSSTQQIKEKKSEVLISVAALETFTS